MSAIAPYPAIQSENNYQYVTLIRDNKLECVSSLKEKTHLLPDFISAPVEEKGSAVLIDQKQFPDPVLTAFPVCSKEQENFISLSSQRMTEGPAQIAGYWMLTLGLKLAAYGINCFTSFKAGEYGSEEDPAVLPYGIVALATTLLPFVSLKSPLVCASAGTAIGYLTKADGNNISLDSFASHGSQNEHPYLNSVVTVHKTFKKSDLPLFSSFYESFNSFKKDSIPRDSQAEADEVTREEKNKTSSDDDRFLQVGLGGEVSVDGETEEEQDFFDDRFFPAGLGSGVLIDEDKVITNYHVIKSKFKKNEYEAKYIIKLADGSQVPVAENSGSG